MGPGRFDRVARSAVPIKLALALLAIGVAPAAAPAAATAAATTAGFGAAGDYPFTVPAGVTEITATVVGAAGGACAATLGGQGAVATVMVPVTPGEQLLVGVGGPGSPCSGRIGALGGFGGGAAGGSGKLGTISAAAGGGGGSFVGIGSPWAGAGVLVAGGGGGGASNAFAGGNADHGGLPGGVVPIGDGFGGGPGRTTGGGSPGSTASGGGGPGTLGFGGAGGDDGSGFGGGGGGGGYFGGGGGEAAPNGAGGGGGGASFTSVDATVVTAPTPTSAPAGVTISYPVPTVSESRSSLHFNTRLAGAISGADTVTVANVGSAPLVVSGYELSGPEPDDYLIGDRCQQPVAPGASCQIAVRFAPQTRGKRSASLQLLTNTAAPPAISLSGTGEAYVKSCKTVTTRTHGKRHKRRKCTTSLKT